jgi:hypothetical protein
MSPPKAARVAADIRDRIHPVSAVAAAQLREAVQIHSQLQGLAGLGDLDGMGNILKNIGNNLRKVGKTVAKVASVIPGPWQIPAIAVTAAATAAHAKNLKGKALKLAAAQSGMSTKDYNAAVKAQKKEEKATIKTQKAADKVAKKTAKAEAKAAKKAGVSVSQQVAAGGSIAVPDAIASEAADVAVNALETVAAGMSKKDIRKAKRAAKKAGMVPPIAGGDVPTDPAAFMQDMLANQGMNFSSGAAQGVLQDVAAQGVEETAEGPSALPSWAIPAGIAAAVVGVALLASKRR